MSFKTLRKENQYQGHAFDVVKVHLQLPDDRQRQYDLVEHGDSVTILPLDESGNIHFVSQHRIGAGTSLLELPAGVLEQGESPLTCANREIREEIGMAARNFKPLGEFFLAPGYSDELMTVFLATGLYPSPLDQDVDEFLNVEILPAAQAYQKALRGDFKDGKTLASFFLAIPFMDVRF